MIRFIDLRKQDTGYNFAFWDTITNRFKEFSNCQAWNSWREFAIDYTGDDKNIITEIERYRSLCPNWIFANGR